MHSPTTTASTPTVTVSSHGLPCTDVPNDFTQMMQLAQGLAEATDFLPENLRGKPGDLLAVMLRARALDIPLAVAWDELYLSGGGIGQSARLLRALARRAGHRIVYVEHDRFHAVALIQRAGEHEAHEVRYTIQDAIAMGLTEGRNAEYWTAQPENMLVARVTSRAVNRYCPEVMLGLGVGHLEGMQEDPAVSSDTIRAVRQEHQDKVDWIARVAELTEKQGNGAVRLTLLRSLYMDARDGLVLDFAADTAGDYSVRNLLTQKMREADLLGKAQAAGTLPPVDPATGPCGLEDLLALLEQAAKAQEAAEAADGEDLDGPQDDPFPQGADAQEAEASPAAPADEAAPVPEEEEKEATAPAGAPAPDATGGDAEAPAEELPAAPQEAPAAPGGRPAARSAARPPARPDTTLPCGCAVADVIRDGKHGGACLDRA